MSGGSWSGLKIFFVIILVLVGIAICAVVGFLIFNRDDPNKRKRFY